MLELSTQTFSGPGSVAVQSSSQDFPVLFLSALSNPCPSPAEVVPPFSLPIRKSRCDGSGSRKSERACRTGCSERARPFSSFFFFVSFQPPS